MHELSIAHSVSETALAELAKHPDHTVTRIVMKIGLLSDVVPDSLAFGFNAIKKESALAQTDLEIIAQPASGRCNLCGYTFEIAELTFQCPHCSKTDIKISGGREIEITYLEIEELDTDRLESTKGAAVGNDTY